MPRQKPPSRPTDFNEPLWARKSVSAWTPKPPVIPPDCDPEVAKKLLADYEDGEDPDPPWTVWGTALFDPGASLAPLNDRDEPVPGGGILVTVTPCKGHRPGTPTAERTARRLAECVNACRGVANPIDFMADVVRLLDRIATDESFDYGDRAAELLARIHKPVPRGTAP